ncbi:MAG: hypothetical protein IIY60_00040, partial [Clostridia bacterium]|nr:hypothetical protein [Clostridia bacterium]
MILKDYAVNIPFDLGGIVVKREKWVEMETERTYPEGKKGSRVKRVTIGQVVPLFPGKMYPNENYFSLVVPNSVPEKIRDDFLRRCERKRELAELKKDPERMMRQVEAGIRFLKEEGRKIKMEQKQQDGGPEGIDFSGTVQTEESEKFWFITDAHELEYVMKVFGDLYNLMEVYASRNPKDTLDRYKAAMFNRILEELKLTMPEHRILQ